MDYVVRVIKGPDAGLQAKLPPGATVVGRGNAAALRLTHDGVSYEHFVIARSGEEFTVENLSARGTFIDGSKITSPTKVRVREQISIADGTVLRVEPENAGATSGWKLAALVGLILIAIGAAIWSFRTPKPTRSEIDHWENAYSQIQPWIVRAGPRPMPDMFRDAWRLEQEGSYQQSQEAWLKLQLLIDSVESKRHMQAASAERDKALLRLLQPLQTDPAPEDDDLAAAFVQFVERRLKFSAAQASAKSKGMFK